MIEQSATLKGTVTPLGQISGNVQKASVAYEKDYEILDNKPQINSHVLIGNQTGNDLGLVDGENELHITEIDRMFQTVFGE